MLREEESRQEYVGLNGIAGTVGINATVEYIVANDDPDLHLARGNDLAFHGKGADGTVDESTVRDFARYLAEFGNQGRRLLDEPMRTSARRMAVVRAIEAHRQRLHFIIDNYVTHPDTGRYLGDPLEPTRDEIVELSAVKNPAEIPWGEGERPVGHVIDATTQILTADQMRDHVRGSVTQAIKTAPAKGNFDFLWVAGITDGGFLPDKHATIAEGACTLQCFGAAMAPLFARQGLKPRRIEFSTIHGVTGDQVLIRRFRPEDMPRGLPGDEDIIQTKSGSADDLAQLVRYLSLRNNTFGMEDNASLAPLVKKTVLTSATRVPAKNSATLSFRLEADGEFTRDDLVKAYLDFAHDNPETLAVEENPIAIASSVIRGRRESGIMFLNTLTVEDVGHCRIVRGTAGYAHEDNSPNASMRISKVIADRKRQLQKALAGGMV